jgi:hypothetical protein
MANDRDLRTRLLRLLGSVTLGLCLLGMPATAHAANDCPWLNEATASGLLGGNATGAFTAADGQPSVCIFTNRESGVTRILQVTVEIAAEPHTLLTTAARACGADIAPIGAIGNEAMMCSVSEHKGEFGERVVGRVRDQVFTIVLSSTLKEDPILTRDALKIRGYTAAEQVAGNLF